MDLNDSYIVNALFERHPSHMSWPLFLSQLSANMVASSPLGVSSLTEPLRRTSHCDTGDSGSLLVGPTVRRSSLPRPVLWLAITVRRAP